MVTVLEHPLITHKLALMRNKETGHKDFRENLDEIASLMAYEVCRDLPTEEVHIETPMGPCDTQMLSGEIILVPILRAGMGLVNGIMDLIPTAKVGFIGLYRDEKTLEPVEYFAKFPKELPDGIVLVLDPMLATGGSAIAAVDMIKKRGAKNIRMVCLVGAPEGVKAFTEAHPDVDLYLERIDYHGDRAATLENLKSLITKHLTHIPYGNLDFYPGQICPSLAIPDIFDKLIVRKGCGGCFELNLLFFGLLRSLGYELYTVTVRCLFGTEHPVVPTHCAAIVTLEGAPYYVDVGLGDCSPVVPVALEEDVCWQPEVLSPYYYSYKVRRDGRNILFEGGLDFFVHRFEDGGRSFHLVFVDEFAE